MTGITKVRREQSLLLEGTGREVLLSSFPWFSTVLPMFSATYPSSIQDPLFCEAFFPDYFHIFS